jgi:hypothetical protein
MRRTLDGWTLDTRTLTEEVEGDRGASGHPDILAR